MMTRSFHRPQPSLSFVLLVILLVALWIAGGASRADALGQVVVRGVAWILLVTAALLGERPRFHDARPVWWMLLLIAGLALLQLVPLPPAWWQGLPGRSLLSEAALASGQSQPWRPLAIVPGATMNALSSLIVPLVALLFVTGLREHERQWLPGLMLIIVAGTTLVGLLQFSGAGFGNPLINDTVGEVSGTFANRNHFALFVAMGCALAPVWAFLGGRRPHWRAPVAFGLMILFALTVLASGSRAGLALGAIGLVVGLLLVQRGVRRLLSRYPRWVFPALIAAVVALVTVFILISVAADRAVAINRALAMDPGQDMRSRGLPVVMAMIGRYFPAGSGFGGFDPLFRIQEPFSLLKPTYFNHAHNDWFEIVLDGGLPGALLLAAAVAWWAWASMRAWRHVSWSAGMLPRLGSVLMLLVFAASIFDYPARTPMIMATIVIAATWLCGNRPVATASALPDDEQLL